MRTAEDRGLGLPRNGRPVKDRYASGRLRHRWALRRTVLGFEALEDRCLLSAALGDPTTHDLDAVSRLSTGVSAAVDAGAMSYEYVAPTSYEYVGPGGTGANHVSTQDAATLPADAALAVPAVALPQHVSGSVSPAGDVLFLGDAGTTNRLVLSVDGAGRLQHNLAGQFGFASAADLDPVATGEQSLVVSQIHSLTIRDLDTTPDDAVTIDTGVLDLGGGSLAITAGTVAVDGTIHAADVSINAREMLNSGSILAGVDHGAGGQVVIHLAQRFMQTESALISACGANGAGGQVVMLIDDATPADASAQNGVFLSGAIRADGGGPSAHGGQITIRGPYLDLYGANVIANGDAGGGQIMIGGTADASTTLSITVNPTSVLRADASATGDGGQIVVDAGHQTTFAGKISARGGAAAGNGGSIEVSGQTGLTWQGTTDLSAPAGRSGSLLLDPKNITIGQVVFDEFIDPHPAAGNQFGAAIVPLSTGNVVVTSYGDDFGGINAGAVYLFSGSNGGLISALCGSAVNDAVGWGGVTALANGNFVVCSYGWNDDRGAVTWGSGTTGVGGTVSSANSLVGTMPTDKVGLGGVSALSNGNYVVNSFGWQGLGAVTWGNGATGVSGTVSSDNSLVGSIGYDHVGRSGVTALSNGNYVVRSPDWSYGLGAVTWGSGNAGISGTISSANSLVGANAYDQVGSGDVTALASGNYVVRCVGWNGNRGAVTWGSGTAGISGAVSSANSLVGATADDRVGTGVTALANGNYVVSSPGWHNGALASAGAVTWGSGTAGITGTISSANSLVGANAGDTVGVSVTALTEGNYVVSSVQWNGSRGAVTWGSGTTGITGTISSANSLVGTSADDAVGASVTALANGSYVIRSAFWDNGTVTDAGAATWASGTAGISGTVSSANSLVGSTAGDYVGSSVTALSNGNYVVGSAEWNGSRGAATWGSGTAGICGEVSITNSLVGTTAYDRVGLDVTALSNGNYVIGSPQWNVSRGAATWGNGTTGVGGTISDTNSLIGTVPNDQVGGGVTALANGNYVVGSALWDNGALADAGVVTWGSGTVGVRGTISSANSLIGTNAYDNVGWGVTPLINGSYLVCSKYWDNGAATDAGAVTWGNGTAGISGTISSANSLVGSTTSDYVGSAVTALANGNYVVCSRDWDNGAVTNAGAATWGNGTTGTSGTITSANSLVGLTANAGFGTIVVDNVNGTFYAPFVSEAGTTPTGGTYGGRVRVGLQAPRLPAFDEFVDPHPAAGNQFGAAVVPLSTGNVAVTSPYDDFGGTDAGAVYLFSGSTGALVSTLRGSNAGDQAGLGGVTALANGNYVVRSYRWNGDCGAATWSSGTAGISGTISSGNSLVGSTAGDQVGSYRVTALSNGNFVVSSPSWNGSRGAATWGNGTVGTVGTVSSGNSLVGVTANDQVGYGYSGYGGVIALSNGNYVVGSPNWDNGGVIDAGAVTWASGTLGVSGTISSGNSLVGSTASDQVGYGGVTALANGNYVVRSYRWNGDRGAATWGSGTAGVSGTVSNANSLVGTAANDGVGFGAIALSNGNYAVGSPNWNGNRGATTWGSGTVGMMGTISSANSLVGANANDYVGGGGVTALSNGHYVVSSFNWNSGQGAATWGSGTAGITGTISGANSLVGSSAGDLVGGSVIALSNGNYVVSSLTWNGKLGAATWGSGIAGISGTVSGANSLIGTSANDYVGRAVTALTNGNYVVRSPDWNGSRGAVTWGNGAAGTVGTVSSVNSLVGTTVGDQVGNGGVTALSNGNYLVRSYAWNGTQGAATWGSGTVGICGEISSANSLVGSNAGDRVGYDGVTALPNGNYVVRSRYWNVNRGAATWGNGAAGTAGVVSSANSLVGLTENAGLGTVAVDNVNGTFYVPFVTEAGTAPAGGTYGGRVRVGSQFAGPLGSQTFGYQPDQSTLLTSAVGGTLNAGTAVTLQANNDITLNAPITADNPGGNGGDLTLQAGRSVVVNADITTDNGNLCLIANETAAHGVVDRDRDAGPAMITMAAGTWINAGSGVLTVTLRNSADKTYNDRGVVSLQDVTAAQVNLVDGVVLVNGTLTGAVAVAAAAVLGGTGTIAGPVVTDGTIAPGSGPGILDTGSITFQTGSTLNVEIGGATAGDGAGHYDRLNVTGTVSFGSGVTLNLASYGGFAPAVGDSFTIINNDGSDAVSGAFNGLPEGATVTIGGVNLTISYTGGDGNDVVLRRYAAMVGRQVFYNNSFFDNPTNGGTDDDAISTITSVLLPGHAATPANYTSYNLGLNGLAIDIDSVPGAAVSASDFQFKIGNTNDPATWASPTASPTVSLRRGAGTGGSDRITLIFADGALQHAWLQVTVLANANTGLSANDVFYFGNGPGDVTGDGIADLYDIVAVFQHNGETAGHPSRYDINGDGGVDFADLFGVYQQLGGSTLVMISAPAGGGALAGAILGSGPTTPISDTQYGVLAAFWNSMTALPLPGLTDPTPDSVDHPDSATSRSTSLFASSSAAVAAADAVLADPMLWSGDATEEPQIDIGKLLAPAAISGTKLAVRRRA